MAKFIEGYGVMSLSAAGRRCFVREEEVHLL